MIRRIREWIDIRIGLDDLIRSYLTEYRVPRNTNFLYTLGIVAFTAYLIQLITGILLLFYYVPQEAHAFKSIQFIMNRVPYGWLFRLIHVVGSNLMVAVVLLHLISVFFLSAYKKPRELTWVSGTLMLLLTLTFCLSGYLLPWSQLNYWATTILTTIPSSFPVLGDFIVKLLRGGAWMSGNTLNRFFALHVGLLPPLLMGLFVLHIFLVRRIGLSSPSGDGKSREWKGFRHDTHKDGQPLYPYLFLKGAFMIAPYFVIMFFIITFAPTLFLPEESNVQADPLNTPEHIRPEWYFLAPYQMFKLIPNKFLGIIFQIILIIVFILWPFFDRSREDNILKRPGLLALFLGVLSLWVVLTIWGSY